MWTQIDRTDRHNLFACCSPRKVLALVHQLVCWLTLTTTELCWQDYICNIVDGTNNNFVIQPRCYQIFTIGSKDPLQGFFASVVLLATRASWKWSCRRVPSAPIPSSVSSSNNGSEVNRLPDITVDPAFTSHFSIKPETTYAP